MSSPSSAVSEDSTSGSRSPFPKPASFATSKLTDTASGFWLPECLTAASIPAPSGETCAPSTGDPGVDAWISSLAASRARTSAMQDGERASEEGGAGCGPSSPDWLAKYDPATCSWRTSALSLFEEWTSCLETWPPSGTMRNGYVCRQQRSALRTSERGSSSLHTLKMDMTGELWPTPAASNPGSNQSEGESQARDGLGMASRMWPTPNVPNGGRTLSPDAIASKGATEKGKRQVGLENVASLWPTPKSSAENYGQPRENDRGDLQAATSLWGTPTSSDWKGPNLSGSGSASSRSVATQALQQWGTPTTRDWKDGACANSAVETNGLLGRQVCRVSLPDQETETPGEPTSKPSRTLNPRFVEALMGFPIGWTVCEALGTPWCPCRLRQHLRSCLND